MRYVSIDIETTGLDHQKCQLIELAAVIDDLRNQKPLEELPKFEAHVYRNTYTGETYALGMHGNFFKRLAAKDKSMNIMTEFDVIIEFRKFLLQNGYPKGQNFKINVAGKNFAGFDKRFIEKLPHADEIEFHHRVLDPAVLYFNPFTDDEIPSLSKCLDRAGMSGEVAHTALQDALQVVKLIRHKFPKE